MPFEILGRFVEFSILISLHKSNTKGFDNISVQSQLKIVSVNRNITKYSGPNSKNEVQDCNKRSSCSV